MTVLQLLIGTEEPIPCAGDVVSFAVEGGSRWLDLGTVVQTKLRPSGEREIFLRLADHWTDVGMTEVEP